ncbi:MAG TPA: DUF3108 domain-containing protein [Rudaea sp.]|nr:DUF3108 domain-containing protein [Rudaea sp.]
MKWLLPLLILTGPAAYAADAPLAPFHAEYQVLRNGKEIGHAVLDLHAGSGGNWEFSSETHGTAGMAALVGLDVVEKSAFRWQDGQPECLHYSYAQKAAIKSRDLVIDCNWSAHAAQVDDNGRPASVALEAPSMDRHLVTLALMHDLAHASAPFDYRVVEKDKVSDQRYVESAREMLALPAGNIEAVKIERDRGADAKRRTTSWFAPARGYLPVQIEQVEKNDVITMRLASMR